ncbi:MAG: class I mannose-6-phosphate isomerase [Chitinispirillaceae bacterium]|nr:class I mannose-6-phosphate isomerase [Chitinispirillaceae bacterium]
MILPQEPLFPEPIYKETIWGGSALYRRFNRPVPPDRTIGESWEIVSLGSDQSVITNGPAANTTLAALLAECRTDLLGRVESFAAFPLLNKFIDAQERLSVQVHPTDRHARTYGWGEYGKTECWYVVDAEPGAQIIVGFKRDVTREQISHAIERTALDELLNYIPIQSGDVLYLPAGTVHAILKGTLIYEVQETSDATLRLYDWGRVDAHGKSRPLHVHDALTVVETRAGGSCMIPPITFNENGYRRSLRMACRYFALEQYVCESDAAFILTAKNSFRVLTVLSGSLRLRYPSGSVEATSGTTMLLPAVLRNLYVSGTAGTDLLVSWVPDLQSEIAAPLRGMPPEQVELLAGCVTPNDLTRYVRP